MSALRLTTVDAVVLGLAAILSLRGAAKGLAWQAIRTGAVVGGFFLAGALGAPVGELLARHAGVPRASADVAGWALVWLACYLVGTYVADLGRNAVRGMRLGTVDRALGMVLGALLGLGIAAFGLVLWASTKQPREIRESLDGSATVEWMARFVRTVKPAFSPGVRARWGPVLDSLEPPAPAPERPRGTVRGA